jgi:hypothetical protein
MLTILPWLIRFESTADLPHSFRPNRCHDTGQRRLEIRHRGSMNSIGVAFPDIDESRAVRGLTTLTATTAVFSARINTIPAVVVGAQARYRHAKNSLRTSTAVFPRFRRVRPREIASIHEPKRDPTTFPMRTVLMASSAGPTTDLFHVCHCASVRVVYFHFISSVDPPIIPRRSNFCHAAHADFTTPAASCV